VASHGCVICSKSRPAFRLLLRKAPQKFESCTGHLFLKQGDRGQQDRVGLYVHA